jgi:hypothetical protein
MAEERFLARFNKLMSCQAIDRYSIPPPGTYGPGDYGPDSCGGRDFD